MTVTVTVALSRDGSFAALKGFRGAKNQHDCPMMLWRTRRFAVEGADDEAWINVLRGPA